MTVQELREALGEWPDGLHVGWMTDGNGIETVGVIGLSSAKMSMDADEQELLQDPQGEQVLLLG